MSLLHAVDLDQLRTIEGTPTECADIVPDDRTTMALEDVTCPGCLAVLKARGAGRRARHAISIGESSGIFADAAVRPDRGRGTGSDD